MGSSCFLKAPYSSVMRIHSAMPGGVRVYSLISMMPLGYGDAVAAAPAAAPDVAKPRGIAAGQEAGWRLLAARACMHACGAVTMAAWPRAAAADA